MKKVAILVEPDFVHKHVGVRNLIFSLYRSFQKNDIVVDFVSFDKYGHSLSWFKIWIDEQSITNNFANKDKCSEGASSKLSQDYRSATFKESSTPNFNEKIVIQRIGGSIIPIGYSAMLISAPWIVSDMIFPDNLKLYGIVYDMIPNNYVIDKANKPFIFASEHLLGYQIYRNYCYGIFSISLATKNSFDTFFPEASTKSFVLPPAVPNYLRLQKNLNLQNKENNIILAGPWDPRKGLERIPRLLKPIAENINTLYIYGKPRCRDEDVLNFLNALSGVKRIIWYEEVSVKTLAELYSKSKILLFPSENEGLGLPLIEAQMLGCRVVCTPFESAKEILVDGYYIMQDDDDINVAKIREMLLEDFDYEALYIKSKDFFAEDNMRNFLKFLYHEETK